MFSIGSSPWHWPGRGQAQWGVGTAAALPEEEQGAALGLFPRDSHWDYGIDFPQLSRWLLVVPIEFRARRPLPGLRGWR